jgi:hypothetical protein
MQQLLQLVVCMVWLANYCISFSTNTITPKLKHGHQACRCERYKFSNSLMVNCYPQIKYGQHLCSVGRPNTHLPGWLKLICFLQNIFCLNYKYFIPMMICCTKMFIIFRVWHSIFPCFYFLEMCSGFVCKLNSIYLQFTDYNSCHPL